MRPRWTRPSSRARPSAPTSLSTWARATRTASSGVRPGFRSTKPAASSDRIIPTPAPPHHIPQETDPMNHRNRTFRRLALAAALSLSTAAVFAAPVTYTMDPDHTTVAAKWNHFGFSNPVILFGDIDGSIVYDADDVSASSVQVTLPLSGLESNVQAFNDHLLSDDFFDAAQFPEATFRSTSVEADGDDELKITGELTIKGITKEVVLEADI